MRRLSLLLMALVAILALMLVALTSRLSVDYDWTAGNRNTLTEASARVLDSLTAGPIEFVAYVYPGARRAEVETRLRRYTRHASAASLRFVDPAAEPQTVRELGIGEDGALQIRYQGRRVTTDEFTEAAITNALQKLSAARDQWVVFLTGHGERAPDDETGGGYSRLAAALDAQGLTTRSLNLAENTAIPDNAAMLVIASPQRELLAGEIQRIREFVAGGGNLLWVDDPGERLGLEALAADLGLRWRGGTLVYPDFRELGTRSPAVAVVANYPDTPITQRLNAISLFPFAGALAVDAADATAGGWQSAVFLRSMARSWLETGSLEGASATFSPAEGDTSGPLNMGVALQRERAGPEGATAQRAAVVADSDFMANGHLDRLANRELALSIFQWLGFRDAQIAVDVARAPDQRLELDPGAIRGLWWLYVVVLPLALLAAGTLRWMIRRRR